MAPPPELVRTDVGRGVVVQSVVGFEGYVQKRFNIRVKKLSSALVRSSKIIFASASSKSVVLRVGISSSSELEWWWRGGSSDATPNQCHIEMNTIIQSNQITMMHSLPILSI